MGEKNEILKAWHRDRSFLTSGGLKLIAASAMLLSHLAQTGLVYSLGYIRLADFFMLIGRLSMPIFSFLIAQGIGLSSDKKKYLLRLLIFALISEIAYDLAFRGNMLDFSNQNVFFSLFLGGFLPTL